MQIVVPVRCALAFGALLWSTSLLAQAAGITAVPPAAVVAPPVEKAAVAARPFLASRAHTVRLPAPTAGEIARLKSANTGPKGVITKKALAIGIGREIPASEGMVRGSAIDWTPLADGGRAARIDIASPEAAGVRLAIAMAATDPDVALRFAGSARPEEIFGPYPANRVAEVAAAQGAFWSPVLQGDTGSIELYIPAGVDPANVVLTVLRVSHLAVAGEGLRGLAGKDASDIGAAGSCEVDVKCAVNPSQALRDTASSVAKMVFTNGSGASYACTGTLINDAVTSSTPYFFTASHCIDSQSAASNLNTYWFFDAVACNSKATPPYVLLSGGAMLLGRSEDYDWALLRLRDAPPPGARFSAWRAESLGVGQAAATMHHPEGDLKKWSQGFTQGYTTYDDGSSFMQMLWTSGSTEPGSSGAGLFTLASAGAYYELRGGLFAGDASCSNRGAFDVFSRFDKALPALRQYLTPNVPNPNGEVAVVEFYNAALDQYFISSNPGEINDLDVGVHPGWVRTGLRFLAYGDASLAPSGASPVCRFYLDPTVGDSHFYSGDPAECAATAARFGASWTFESPGVFWIVLPDRTTGACPTGLRPVYRFFNTMHRAPGHRYTAEVDVRDTLAGTPGWVAEGYGPQAVIMCSPET